MSRNSSLCFVLWEGFILKCLITDFSLVISYQHTFKAERSAPPDLSTEEAKVVEAPKLVERNDSAVSSEPRGLFYRKL